MTCDEIRPWLATRRHISFAQEQAVQAHLTSCTRCAALWQREERIMQRFRATPQSPGELDSKTRAAIHTEFRSSRPLRWWTRERVVLLSVALVALLAVGLFPTTIQNVLPTRLGSTTLFRSSPTAPITPPATATTGTLYIASSVTDPTAQADVGARITAINPASWHERYRVEGGDEATLSPDQTRLYVAGSVPGSASGDAVRAIDAATGNELWHISIDYRAGYPGQSNLIVSPDGHWLYVRSYDQKRGSGDAGTVPFWLQIIDTTTGARLSKTIPLPNIYTCGAPTLASPPAGNAVYVSCYSGTILAINTQTQQIEPLLPQEVRGAILSPISREMYAVSATLDIFTLDSVKRTLLRKVTMHPRQPFSSTPGLVALSGDGRWLVAGQTIQGRPGTDTACEIRVLDARTGEEVSHFRYERPLHSFVVDASGTVLYAAIGVALATDTTIVEFSLPGGQLRAERHRPREDISQLFLGP